MGIELGFSSDVSDALAQLNEALQEHVVRAAAHAGAKVLQDEARSRAHVYDGPPRKLKSGLEIKPGQLRDSIYRVFSKANSGDTVKTYEISWNHTRAPHGFWMEYGIPSRNIAGRAFIRGAMDRSPDALAAMQERAKERILEVFAELL